MKRPSFADSEHASWDEDVGGTGHIRRRLVRGSGTAVNLAINTFQAQVHKQRARARSTCAIDAIHKPGPQGDDNFVQLIINAAVSGLLFCSC